MRFAICLLCASFVIILPHRAAAATGQVELEIAGDSAIGAGMSFQEWSRALAAGGVTARLRSGENGDKPGIVVGGTEQQPFYKVTAVLGSGDQLIMPGGVRFRRSECKKLAAWLDDLAKHGPPDKREKVVAFGLTASQLNKVNADLAKTVGFTTKGMTRSDAVSKIAGQLGFTLSIEGELTEGDDKIEEELSGLSSGTALACILRPIGFCMVPHEAGDSFAYTVKKSELDQPPWPIGLPAADTQKALPGFYEFHKVTVANVPAVKLLGAIGKQLDVPVLYDHNAMARHGIDLDKALVSANNPRTTYSVSLRTMLNKVRLKFKIRTDEAGKTFLWITTVKPV